jgi:hypothetical protein
MTPFVAEFAARLVADTHEIKGLFRVPRVGRGRDERLDFSELKKYKAKTNT